MKRGNIKHFAAASLLGCAGLAISASAQAATANVTYNGVTYVVNEMPITYSTNTALLTSQPWYGDKKMADAMAGANVLPNNLNFNNRSAYYAYSNNTSTQKISASTYYSAAVNGTPGVYTDLPADAGSYWYAYTLATRSILDSVQTSNGAVSTAVAGNALLINGADSHPLEHLVEKGKKAFWVSGDIGKNNHSGNKGNSGIGEVGFGYNFGRVQLNLSAGNVWNHAAMANNNASNTRSQFIAAETIIPLSEARGVYGTLGVYGLRGSADVFRNYVDVTGAAQSSYGNPGTSGTAARARLDWLNAGHIRATGITPYLDLSYYKSRTAAYAEIGGSAPAVFNESTDHSTQAHLGINTVTPTHFHDARILFDLEVAHSSTAAGSGVSGYIPGVVWFSYAGQAYSKNWGKAGIGFDDQIGKGKLFVMLNGTTNSTMPSAWLAASYQVAF